MKRIQKISFIIMVLSFLFTCWAGFSQNAEVVEKITVPNVKLDGIAWDGSDLWVVTYESSPIKWQIAKVGADGDIVFSFVVPVDSLDDVHNFGMSNITSDKRTIWANHWNAGLIYRFSKKGKEMTKFGVPSVNQLIPVGIAWDGKYLWVLHWSDRNLYKLDSRGKELDKVSLRKVKPPVDKGLAWDGENFWVGSGGANRITRITPEGEVTGFIKGPRESGGIRDLDWDGEHLLVVYQQGDTIYKVKISE
jgi:sugar lactone lactonase YvrE